MRAQPQHLTCAQISLSHLTHNLALLRAQAGGRPLWPAIKANAYGHGALVVARHLVGLGVDTLCVAQVNEAIELIDCGIQARFVVLSGAVPSNAALCVHYGLEPVVTTDEMLAALEKAAKNAKSTVSVHLKVDTGMGRLGLASAELVPFLRRCAVYPSISVRGIMSHFARADEADKSSALEQIRRFTMIREATAGFGVPFYHMANSAGILDLPQSVFDAARPGIALYGLKPSAGIINPIVQQLRPVLTLSSRIIALKEVEAGVGLSYGHAYRTTRATVVATVPVGYGDGISRRLSGRLMSLVGGKRCPQIGRITMDQMLLDVTELRGKVVLGESVVLIGSQSDPDERVMNTVSADEIAALCDTINYEVVTAIAQRVPRIAC